MKKLILNLALCAIVIPATFSSCATIFGKSSYPVAIRTDPQGAAVTITDKKSKEVFKGQTPCTVTLKSGAGYFTKAEYQVKLNAPGYAEQVLPIYFKLNGWYFGNLLVGGALGMLIVDPLSGAMWKLDTPGVNVTLNKSTTAMETPTLQIVDFATISPELKQHLVRIK
jgi:hypothetical protein